MNHSVGGEYHKQQWDKAEDSILIGQFITGFLGLLFIGLIFVYAVVM